MKFIEVSVKMRLEMYDESPDGISEGLESISWADTVRKGLGIKGMKSLQIQRIIPGTRKLVFGSAEDERAFKDQKLGVKSLRESKCDECDTHAFTRWYSGKGKHERIEMTLCKKHNDEMLKESRAQRKRLGLDSPTKKAKK